MKKSERKELVLEFIKNNNVKFISIEVDDVEFSSCDCCFAETNINKCSVSAEADEVDLCWYCIAGISLIA